MHIFAKFIYKYSFFLFTTIINFHLMSKPIRKECKCSISGYEVSLTYSKHCVDLCYYDELDPTRVYQNVFSSEEGVATNPITSKKIKQIFRSFLKFYQYISDFSQDKNRIDINNLGYVTIYYYRTKTKTKKAQKIQFDGHRLVTTEQLKEQEQIKNGIVDVKAENIYLKQTLDKLYREDEKEAIELAKLRSMVLQDKDKYLGQLKMDTKYLQKESQYGGYKGSQKHQIKELAEMIKQLQSDFKIIIDRFNSKIYQKPILQTPQFEQKIIDEQEQQYGQKFWVVLDRNNKYLQNNYKIDGNTLIKTSQYSSYQVLGKDPFPIDGGKYYFSLFIEKVSFNIFSVGIANQNRRNYETSHNSEDCMTYFAKNGTVWQNGNSIGGGPCIQNGTEIRVVVDFKLNLIKWFQNGKQIGGAGIVSKMINQRLVPYIQLNYPNDRVTFNEKPSNWLAKQAAK